MLHAICRFALFTWKAFSDGFTNDNLSNVTGVYIDLINRVDEKKLTQEDIKQLNSLLCFLSQIYLEDVENGKNLKDIVHVLVSHFGLAYDTIAHYLELKTSELDEFLSKPEKYRNTYNLSLNFISDFWLSAWTLYFQTFLSIEKHSFYHEFTTIEWALIWQ